MVAGEFFKKPNQQLHLNQIAALVDRAEQVCLDRVERRKEKKMLRQIVNSKKSAPAAASARGGYAERSVEFSWRSERGYAKISFHIRELAKPPTGAPFFRKESGSVSSWISEFLLERPNFVRLLGSYIGIGFW